MQGKKALLPQGADGGALENRRRRKGLLRRQ